MLAAKLIFLVAVNLVNSVLGFVCLCLVSRHYGDTGLGALALAMSFVGLFEFFPKMGIDTAHIKRISEGIPLGQGIGAYTLLKLALTTVFVVITLSALGFLDALKLNIYRQADKAIISIFLVVIVFRGLADVPIQTFAAQRMTLYQAFPLLAGALTRFCGVILVIMLRLELVMVALVYLIAEIINMLTAFLAFRNYPFEWPSAPIIKSYRDFAAPMFLVNLSASLEKHIDKLLLALFLNTQAVAHYFGPQRLTYFLEITASALSILYLPSISRLISTGTHDSCNRLVLITERYLVLVFTPLGIFVYLCSQAIMMLFGQNFQNSYAILQYLSLSTIIALITIPFSDYILAADHPAIRMVLSLLMRLLNLSLLLILIPSNTVFWPSLGYGVTGAALAHLISRLVFFATARLIFCYMTRTSFRPFWLLACLSVAAILTKLLGPLSSSLTSMAPILGTTCLLPTISLLYWLALFALRLIKSSDISYVYSVAQQSYSTLCRRINPQSSAL